MKRVRVQFGVRWLLVLLTVASVSIAAFLAWFPWNQRVVVAAENLDIGTQITDSNVKYESWPADICPNGFLASKSECEDKFLMARAREGQVICADDLISKAQYELRFTVPEGYFVTGIWIPPYNGGLLQSGDNVSVCTKEESGESRQLIAKARVFKVVDHPAKPWGHTVGILLTEDEVDRITELNETGSLRLAPVANEKTF